VRVQVRNLKLHARDQFSVPDNIRAAIDVLHACNMLEHNSVETVREYA
jgi:hypothetical protein